MKDILLIILIILGTSAGVMLIKYLVYKIFDKAGDSIRNKKVEQRNSESKGPEPLADRYKEVMPELVKKEETKVLESTVEEHTETIEPTTEEAENTSDNKEE